MDEGRGKGLSIKATFRSMPPPSELKEYNKIHKGFGSKMLKDTLEEKRHQRAMEKKMVNTFEKESKNRNVRLNVRLALEFLLVASGLGVLVYFQNTMPEYIAYTLGAVLVALMLSIVLPRAFDALGRSVSAISSKGGKR